MAKKTSPSDGGELQAEGRKVRETILSLKGTPEWSQWLGELAVKFRTKKAGIIDRALAEFAQRNGFREPPER
jgi:hypothetical protein